MTIQKLRQFLENWSEHVEGTLIQIRDPDTLEVWGLAFRWPSGTLTLFKPEPNGVLIRDNVPASKVPPLEWLT